MTYLCCSIYFVQRQQFILIISGLASLVLLFFGTTNVASKVVAGNAVSHVPVEAYNEDSLIGEAKEILSPDQLAYITARHRGLRGNTDDNQRVAIYSDLAKFWKDSVRSQVLYVFYLGESAKLVNSEKNLTFAAQLMLDALRNEQSVAKRNWEADQAETLFTRAISLNNSDKNIQVGLASCYIFGRGMTGDAAQTMKGIQMLLRIVKNDSLNIKAQLVLGIGGVISNQFDKAIPRLSLVVKNQPKNIEAVSWLADAYAAKGDKANAVKWYTESKKLVNNPQYSKEVDERIRLLK